MNVLAKTSVLGAAAEIDVVLRSWVHLDTLRVRAAKLLATFAQRGKCVVSVDGVEKLDISADMVAAYMAFSKTLEDFGRFVSVDRSRFAEKSTATMGAMDKHISEAQSWRRVLGNEIRATWVTGVQRLADGLMNVIPKDWRRYTVEERDDKLIMQHVVNNEALNCLLARQSALQASATDFDAAMVRLAAPAMDPPQVQTITSLVEEAKVLIAIRAASTVTLVRLPAATTPKSKQGFVRECKRLVAALQIVLPGSVLAAMESAAQ